ncbi:phage tail protein [Salmonella enterica]|nr:phage tail protein [Salmonella enterica]
MAQTVITSAFERYKAQEAAGGRRILLDRYIFASIPDLDPDTPPGKDDAMPAAEHIVWRQNVDTSGMVNEDVVTYSVTLMENVGDFSFNWMGLINSESGTLCLITHLEPQMKVRTADGRQGNVLNYSSNLKFSGASEQTGITTPVSTWQIDFTARLRGMDEATRLASLDIYGNAIFFNDAFKVTKTGVGTAMLSPGAAYLRGLRVEMDQNTTLTYTAGKDQTISVDCALKGTLTGENAAVFTLVNQPTRDYIDGLGFAHFVEPIARIARDGTITDLRKTRKPTSQVLDGDYLSVAGNLKEIAAQGANAVSEARRHLNLGSSATCNVGKEEGTVAAGDDLRITGAMQKDQNGADIPDKAAFIEHIGMKDTLNPTQRVSIGSIGNGAFDGSTPCINIGDSDSGFIGSADGVIDIYCNNIRVGYINNTGLHMLTDIYSGDARITTNGDILGSVWENNWLSIWLKNQLNTRGTIDWINNQLTIRDNNINARATINWVNQNFANKNTASLATNGWFRDATTGWMVQWGTYPGGTGTYIVNLPQPFPHAALWVLGWVNGALSYGDDDWSNSAGLVNNSQIRVTVDHGWSTSWIAIGY